MPLYKIHKAIRVVSFGSGYNWTGCKVANAAHPDHEAGFPHALLSRFREFGQRDEWKDCSSASH